MKIGIDISRTTGEMVGVGRYAQELVKGLAQIDNKNRYLLYPYFWHCFPKSTVFDWIPKKKNFKLYHSWIPRRFIFDLMHKTNMAHDWFLGSPDVVHSVAFTSPLLTRSKLVVTFLDMTFLTHPEYHFEENRLFCLEQSRLASQRANHIIAISEQTKRDIVDLLHIPLDKITVIYLAAADIYQIVEDMEKLGVVTKKYGVNSNFLFFVGSIEPRKNLRNLLRAYNIIESSLQKEFPLVIVGAKGWLNSDVYELVVKLGIQDKVKFLGYVPDEDLVFLYNAATAFIYPSLYEGFGLPVLEAMACGTPVITSNISSLPEVAGDAALLADPSDVEALAAAITTMLSDESLRDELKARGVKRSQEFSWERTARKTLDVYKRTVGFG